jgi:hypothetical protein
VQEARWNNGEWTQGVGIWKKYGMKGRRTSARQHGEKQHGEWWWGGSNNDKGCDTQAVR